LLWLIGGQTAGEEFDNVVDAGVKAAKDVGKGGRRPTLLPLLWQSLKAKSSAGR
jgi:hypothetical protein